MQGSSLRCIFQWEPRSRPRLYLLLDKEALSSTLPTVIFDVHDEISDKKNTVLNISILNILITFRQFVYLPRVLLRNFYQVDAMVLLPLCLQVVRGLDMLR